MFVPDDDLLEAHFNADCRIARVAHTGGDKTEAKCVTSLCGEAGWPRVVAVRSANTASDFRELEQVKISTEKADGKETPRVPTLAAALGGNTTEYLKVAADLAQANSELEAAIGLIGHSHAGATWALRELARRTHGFIVEYYQFLHDGDEARIREETANFFKKDMEDVPPNGGFEPTWDNMHQVLYVDGNLRELWWLVMHGWFQVFKFDAVLREIMHLYGWNDANGRFEGDPPEPVSIWIRRTRINVEELKRRQVAIWRCRKGEETCVEKLDLFSYKPGWVWFAQANRLRKGGAPLEDFSVQVREKTGKFEKHRVLGQLTQSRLGAIGLPSLSQRECQFLQSNPKFPPASPCSDLSEIIQWPVGGRIWRVLDNKGARPGPSRANWAARLQGLGLPTTAAPSASVDGLLAQAQMLGLGKLSEMELLRLAAASQLDPYHHHSWAEIAVAAQPFGVPWRLLQPFENVLPERGDTSFTEANLVQDGGRWTLHHEAIAASWPTGVKFEDVLLEKVQQIRSSMRTTPWMQWEVVRPVQTLTISNLQRLFPATAQGLDMTPEDLCDDMYPHHALANKFFPGASKLLQERVCGSSHPLLYGTLQMAVCGARSSTSGSGGWIGVGLLIGLCFLVVCLMIAGYLLFTRNRASRRELMKARISLSSDWLEMGAKGS